MPSNSCWTRSSYDSTNFAKTFGLLRLWCRMWNLSYANGNGLCLSERVSMYSIDRFTKPRLQRKDRLGDGVTSSGPAWVHSLSAILQHASSGWRLGYFPFYWTFKVLVTLTKVFPADSWRSEVWWTWPHPGRGRGGESLQSGRWFGVCHFQWKSFHQLFGLTDCSFSREYMFRSKLG